MAGLRLDRESLIVTAMELIVFALLLVFLRAENIVLGMGALTVALIILYAAFSDAPWGEPLQQVCRERSLLVRGLAILLVLLLPLFLRDNSYWIFVLVLAGIYCIMVVGLNIQIGSTDMVNLGFAGFWAIGAYTAAILATVYQVPFWISLPLAGLAASLAGALVALPTARTRGYYFSLVTIAFGITVYLLLMVTPAVGGPDGISGIPAPSFAGHSFRDPLHLAGVTLPPQANFYYLVVLLTLLSVAVSNRLKHSPVGLAWNAVREDEIAARCGGIDVARAKLQSMAIGCFFAGIAGAVYAHLVGFIAPENFTFLHSVTMVTMVILGGMDNVVGVLAGAVLLTVVPEKFRAFDDFRLFFYGIVIVGMLIFRPHGLFPAPVRRFHFRPRAALGGVLRRVAVRD